MSLYGSENKPNLDFLKEYLHQLQEKERITKESWKILRPHLSVAIHDQAQSILEGTVAESQQEASMQFEKEVGHIVQRAREYWLELQNRLGGFPLPKSIFIEEIALLSAIERMNPFVVAQATGETENKEDTEHTHNKAHQAMLTFIYALMHQESRIRDFITGGDLTLSSSDSTEAPR